MAKLSPDVSTTERDLFKLTQGLHPPPTTCLSPQNHAQLRDGFGEGEGGADASEHDAEEEDMELHG